MQPPVVVRTLLILFSVLASFQGDGCDRCLKKEKEREKEPSDEMSEQKKKKGKPSAMLLKQPGLDKNGSLLEPLRQDDYCLKLFRDDPAWDSAVEKTTGHTYGREKGEAKGIFRDRVRFP